VVSAAGYDAFQSLDSEDCLFVNICKPPNADKLPVVVWFKVAAGIVRSQDCAVELSR
jgi:hypothetical protein